MKIESFYVMLCTKKIVFCYFISCKMFTFCW